MAPFLAQAVDPPSAEAVDNAIELLKRIRALDSDEQLTALGHHLAHLPCDPLIGKTMILGAIFSCLEPILNVCGALSFKDPFHTPLDREREVLDCKVEFSADGESDHLAYSNALQAFAQGGQNDREWQWRNFISATNCRQALGMRSQFADYLHWLCFTSTREASAPMHNRNSNDASIVKAVLTLGLYPNVATVPLRTGGDGTIRKHPAQNYKLDVSFMRRQVEVFRSSVVNRLEQLDCGAFVAFSAIRRGQGATYSALDATLVRSPLLLGLVADDCVAAPMGKAVVGTLKAELDGGWIRMRTNRPAFQAIVTLRDELSALLRRCYAKPELVSAVWSTEENANRVLLDLIASLVAREMSGAVLANAARKKTQS